MENLNMTKDQLIKELFNLHVQESGNHKITEFKKTLDLLIKQNISGVRGLSKVDNNWRSEQKAKFSGRGAKWVKVSIEEVMDTVDRLASEGFDTEGYEGLITKVGFAWIRYSGPRIQGGVQKAAFEVRLQGSTVDCPSQLHMIDNDKLDEVINVLGGTPLSLGLEKKEVVVKEEVEVNEANEEVIEEEVNNVLLAAEEIDDEDDLFGDL